MKPSFRKSCHVAGIRDRLKTYNVEVVIRKQNIVTIPHQSYIFSVHRMGSLFRAFLKRRWKYM